MKTYDVVIVGSDLTSYVSAFYLAQKTRQIAWVKTPNESTYEYLKKPLIDSDKQRYYFDYPYRELGGLEPNQLAQNYLEAMGLSELTLNVIKQKHTEIIQTDEKRYYRPNDLQGFRIYLVRHYPRYRDRIYRFFDDMTMYYEDFKTQRFERFKERPYRLSKMVASFRNDTLETILKRYFDNPVLREEFRFFQAVDGYQLNEIHAVEYFKRFFNSMIEQSYYLVQTDKSIHELFDLQSIEHIDIYENQVKTVKKDKDIVVSVMLEDGIEIQGEYFLFDHIFDFTKPHFTPLKGRFKQSFYVALSTPAEELGIESLNLLFSESTSAKSLRIIQYGYFHPKQKPSLRIEAVNPVSEEAMIEEIIRYFPKLKNHITKVKAGDIEPLYTSVIETRKMSLEATDAIDRLNHRYSMKNALYSGNKIAQESGLIGRLMLGVELAERIEKRLIQKESETIKQQQNLLISKLLHGYKQLVITDDVMVAIDFGKRTVPIRFNHQHAYVYHAAVKMHLTIHADYDVLNQLLQGQTTISKALEDKQLTFTGDVNLFRAITASLRLGTNAQTLTESKSYQKPYGIYLWCFNMISLMVWLGISSQIQLWIPTIAFLSIMNLKIIIQWFRIKHLAASDLINIGLALFVLGTQYFDLTLDITSVLVIYAGILLISILRKKPLLFYEFHRDEKPEDAFTYLYVTMMQGLTWLWIIAFGVSSVILRFVPWPNTWLYVYVFIIMISVSLRYKKNYINTVIKGRM